MKEYLTDALVLDVEESGDSDLLIYLYTPTLGRVKARAKSARKITSKLAGHLQPLDFVKVRLVEKNGVQVVDAVRLRQVEKSPAALALLRFIKATTFEFHADKKFWLLIKKSFDDLRTGQFSYKPLLEALGFAPAFAKCHICESEKVAAFSIREHLFFCRKCVSKIPKDEVIYIQCEKS